MGYAETSGWRWVWRSLIVLALLWTVWASLVPVASLPSVDLWDKAAHAVNYGVLTMLLVLAMKRPRPWVAAGWVMACGMLIELAQAATGYRTGDWKDAAANGVGIICAALLIELIMRARNARSGVV